MEEVEDMLRRNLPKLGEDVDLRQTLAAHQQRRFAAADKVRQLLPVHCRRGVRTARRRSPVVPAVQNDAHSAGLDPLPVYAVRQKPSDGHMRHMITIATEEEEQEEQEGEEVVTGGDTTIKLTPGRE